VYAPTHTFFDFFFLPWWIRKIGKQKMPIYEFICEECFEEFEELVGFNQSEIQLNCPACGSELIRKKVSSFAALGSSLRKQSTVASSSCGPGVST
jgi:putative FmdB family regulatory protein